MLRNPSNSLYNVRKSRALETESSYLKRLHMYRFKIQILEDEGLQIHGKTSLLNFYDLLLLNFFPTKTPYASISIEISPPTISSLRIFPSHRLPNSKISLKQKNQINLSKIFPIFPSKRKLSNKKSEENSCKRQKTPKKKFPLENFVTQEKCAFLHFANNWKICWKCFLDFNATVIQHFVQGECCNENEVDDEPRRLRFLGYLWKAFDGFEIILHRGRNVGSVNVGESRIPTNFFTVNSLQTHKRLNSACSNKFPQIPNILPNKGHWTPRSTNKTIVD